MDTYGLLSRSVASPAAYRVLFAAAAALPALLLVARCRHTRDADAWFGRHARRWLPLLGALASLLFVAGLAGGRACDPHRYVEAKSILGGPAALAPAINALFTAFTFGALRSDDALEARRSLERFFGSPAVSEPIKAEVRAACPDDGARPPLSVHNCAHDVLQRGRTRLESRRVAYVGLAVAGFPIGGIALCFWWRGSRRRRRTIG